jgi:hypothetical protein
VAVSGLRSRDICCRGGRQERRSLRPREQTQADQVSQVHERDGHAQGHDDRDRRTNRVFHVISDTVYATLLAPG